MTTTSDFINIQISRETTAVTRAAFNIPCYIAAHAAFTERARTFSSLSAVGELFDSASPVYKAATKVFGQDLVPQSFVIGRRAVAGGTISVSSVLASYAYKFTVNGQEISFTSDPTPTATEIVTGLKAAFDAATPAITDVTATVVGSTLVLAAAGDWSVKVGTNLSLVYNAATESWADTIAAVNQANSNWFGLTANTHVKADQSAIAAVVETYKRLYFTSSSDSTAKATTTTDIGATLKDLGYDNTMVMWAAEAETEEPEVAVMAKYLQYTPGSADLMYKQFDGISTQKLTDNEIANLKAKNYSVYESVGGVNILHDGNCVSGEPVDNMVVTFWTEARMRERIYSKLVNMLKLPFTRNGAAMIEADIRAIYQEGVINGAFSPDVPPIISVPDPVTLDQNLRILRKLEGITFQFRFAGSVRYLGIFGTLSA